MLQGSLAAAVGTAAVLQGSLAAALGSLAGQEVHRIQVAVGTGLMIVTSPHRKTVSNIYK